MSLNKNYPPDQFTTWRMECRKYQASDASPYYDSIQKNSERLLDRFPELVQQAKEDNKQEAFETEKLSSWENAQAFSFSIWDKATGEFAGEVSFLNLDWKIPKAEITCFLTKAYEGRGIMSEVLKKAVKVAFEELKLNKLYIRMRPNNNRSSQMAIRSGFVKEGIIRNDFLQWNNTLCDLCYYGITSQEYFKAQQVMHQYAQA